MFNQIGKETPVFLRFSTFAGERCGVFTLARAGRQRRL
jgi:catalase